MTFPIWIPFPFDQGLEWGGRYFGLRKLFHIDPQSVIPDRAPATTTSERGTPLKYFLGRRHVGPTVGWVGDRKASVTTQGEIGKGLANGGGVKVAKYTEAAWHQLCLGPISKLHAIYANGTAIFTGPIDPSTHPSGSTISLGAQGSFDIYWGTTDQPPNDFLAQPARAGVRSQWPFCAYVVWTKRSLGTVAVWPQITYELECRPTLSGLSQSSPWIYSTTSVDPTTYQLVAFGNGGPTIAFLTVKGKWKTLFTKGRKLKLTDNAAAGDYLIRSSSHVKVTYTDPILGSVQIDATKIILDATLSGASSTGNVFLYNLDPDDGANAAHCLAQLLMAPRPHGAGIPSEFVDMASFEIAGQVLEAEKLLTSLQIEDSLNPLSSIDSTLADAGAMLVVIDGKLTLRLIRDPGDPNQLPSVPEELIGEEPPQPKTMLGAKRADRVSFVWSDRRRRFRDLALSIRDDGRPGLVGKERGKPIVLSTVIDFATAARVAERRVLEQLVEGTSVSFTAMRGAAELNPGDAIVVEGFADVMRVVSKRADGLNGGAQITVAADHYGVSAVTFTLDDSGVVASAVDPPTEDIVAMPVELPAYLLQGGKEITLSIPRIRSSQAVVGALLHLSTDGSTYVSKGADYTVQTGGQLAEAMPATGPYFIESGPLIVASGPDIANVLDLSGNTTAWKAGKQIAIVDGELFYIRNLEAVSGSVWRLRGLLRARLGTKIATHAIGSFVIICDLLQVQTIKDIVLAPGLSVLLKVQPIGSGAVPLQDLPAIPITIKGNGVVPMTPAALRTSQGSSSYKNGDNITLFWNYRSAAIPKTGAGMQPAGLPTGISPAEGKFAVKLRTSGGVLKKTFTVEWVPEGFTIQNSQIISAFGSQPTSFIVEVTHIVGGYSSDPVSMTIVKV